VETVFSMLKRNQGPAPRSRSHHAQCREVRLRILTHNLAALFLPKRSFGQSRWLLSNQTGFYGRDLAVGKLVCEEPLLIEAFDLSQIPVHL